MLSTLVQRQKIWMMPLLLSLAFSWCFMLCQNVALALPTQNADLAASQTAMPPCHSQVAADIAPQSAKLNAQHCSGCDNQAAVAEPLALAFSAVLVSWHGIAELSLQLLAIPVQALDTPPPRTAIPLYLAKNLLLI